MTKREWKGMRLYRVCRDEAIYVYNSDVSYRLWKIIRREGRIWKMNDRESRWEKVNSEARTRNKKKKINKRRELLRYTMYISYTKNLACIRRRLMGGKYDQMANIRMAKGIKSKSNNWKWRGSRRMRVQTLDYESAWSRKAI